MYTSAANSTGARRVFARGPWPDMSQPPSPFLQVSDTAVYTLPLYRLAGVYAPANGEFSSRAFELPSGGVDGLYLNGDCCLYTTVITMSCIRREHRRRIVLVIFVLTVRAPSRVFKSHAFPNCCLLG